MKREHEITDEYIGWLKSLGCVLYIPFDYVNGAKDVISGVELVETGYGSMEYDAVNDMYKMNFPTQNSKHIAHLPLSMRSFDWGGNCYTVISTVLRGNGKYLVQCAPNYADSINNALSVGVNASMNTSRWDDNVHKCARTSSYSERSWYDNKVKNTYSAYTPELPSNWSYVLNDNMLFGVVYSTGSGNGNVAYVRDYYLFNSVLADDDIYKIQGYEL